MNKKRRLLKALLVAINDYPNPDHRLKGCINDLDSIRDFLDYRYDQSEVEYQPIILKDEQATKDAVINTFLSHFGDLEDSDVGLFFFAGHGSRGDAPKGYWHDSPSRKYETLVCYDSRQKGGRDLADKELSYLLWKVTEGKDVHFTAIVDACHSGSVFREDDVKIRAMDDRSAESGGFGFFGESEYEVRGHDIFVPGGRHVLLSACRDTQYAKEKTIDEKRRGVFTYSLVQALQRSNGQLSYKDLKSKIQSHVYNNAKNQHPQIVATYQEDIHRKFLDSTISPKLEWCLVYHDKVKSCWVTNVGRIHGLDATNNLAHPAKLLLFEESAQESDLHKEAPCLGQVEIEHIYASYSKVKVDASQDVNKRFKAIFLELPISKLNVFVSREADLDGVELINQVWAKDSSTYLNLVDHIDDAAYVVLSWNDQYSFCRRGSCLPMFRKIRGYSEIAAYQLLSDIETYHKWSIAKGIASPFSNIDEDIVDLELYEVIRTTPDFLHVKEERRIDSFLTEPVVLNYTYNDSHQDPELKWEEPMFRLKIKNTSDLSRRIWCSLVCLSSDYSVSNELLPKQSLGPGEEVWIKAFDEDYNSYTSLVPLDVDDTFIKMGINEVMEHFKVIVSTEEFDTSDLNQEGIPLDFNKDGLPPVRRKRKSRGFQGVYVQWAVFDFEIKVIRPSLTHTGGLI